ncbi:MAG: hypothetical protein K5773_00945 [Pseudobutyrivibrio sp.]|nr:hypothetical protein [Pseudobutyrivibrio sp.]
MTVTNRFSWMRFFNLLGVAIIFIASTIAISLLNSLLIDKVICLLALDICFFFMMAVDFTLKRIRGVLPEDNLITYGKVLFVVLIDFVIMILSSQFAPDFFAPVMLFVLIASTVFHQGTNAAFGIFLVSLLAVANDISSYMLICYILLISFGIIISSILKIDDSLNKICGLIMIFSINTLIPVIFYYFTYLEISFNVVMGALAEGLFVCLLSSVFVVFLNRIVAKEQTMPYELYLSPDYSLYQDIHKFSYIEFTHAKRVSALSRECARAINANVDLAATAGFYYRLGKLEGEPIIDNALKIANNHCFPIDVIKILSEYGCILNLPSTKESAIVHMVDSVVTKVELFDSDSMSSSWNQNMVIYQTINELSQKGYYDNSGLTMNQFLIIRERLAKEDILNDSLY